MALKINLTSQEAKSKARIFEVLPSGAYLCNIINISEEEVRPGKKNSGKPYWNIDFIVDQGSKYDGRHIFTNVMLFAGAAYSIKQLVESIFPDMVEDNELTIPDAEAFIGKQVVVVVQKFHKGSKERGTTRVREKDEIKVTGFMPANTAPKTTEDNSLLP